MRPHGVCSNELRRLAFVAIAAATAASCTIVNSLDRYQAEGPGSPDGFVSPGTKDGGGGGTTTADGQTITQTDGQTGGPTDGQTGGQVDARIPDCDLKKPFGAPVPIAELNSAQEDTLSDLSPDELTLYFGSNRAGTGLHLYFTTRANRDATWGTPPTLLFPLGAFDDWSVTVSPNGRTSIVASSRAGNTDLYVATRATPLEEFGPLALVAGTNSAAPDESPHWANDTTLYFDSSRSGSRHIYRTTIVGTAFSPVEAVAELNTSAFNAVPVVSSDELTIYFSSDRAAGADPGDIYVATRAAKDAPFTNITPVATVNSTLLEAPAFISPNGCTLYLSRTAIPGSFDMYVAKRPR